jgi:hypothetical protein
MATPEGGSIPNPPSHPRTRRPRLSKQGYIGLGLLLTLVGLFLVVLLFPTSPGALSWVLPVAAVGLVALWVGGILMGIGSRS